MWNLLSPSNPLALGFDGDPVRESGISLLHLSWGHPRQALPVIHALWSPDFPHPGVFTHRPRLSNLVAPILYPKSPQLSNILQILLPQGIIYNNLEFAQEYMQMNFDAYFQSLQGKKITLDSGFIGMLLSEKSIDIFIIMIANGLINGELVLSKI